MTNPRCCATMKAFLLTNRLPEQQHEGRDWTYCPWCGKALVRRPVFNERPTPGLRRANIGFGNAELGQPPPADPGS